MDVVNTTDCCRSPSAAASDEESREKDRKKSKKKQAARDSSAQSEVGSHLRVARLQCCRDEIAGVMNPVGPCWLAVVVARILLRVAAGGDRGSWKMQYSEWRWPGYFLFYYGH